MVFGVGSTAGKPILVDGRYCYLILRIKMALILQVPRSDQNPGKRPGQLDWRGVVNNSHDAFSFWG